MVKKTKLEMYIDYVCEKTGLPYWIARIEIADEAGVGNAHELSDEDIERMIETVEKYFNIG